MSKKIVVVAPHPDDETLGCGGTLLRHRDAGDAIHWLIITGMHPEQGFSPERIQRRQEEINRVASCYNFTSVHSLNFPTAKLDTVPTGEIVSQIGNVFQQICPDLVYLPHRGDVHSDHGIVADAVTSCTKWFRYPTVKRVLAYEILSETDFNINPDSLGFRPNVFVDISQYIDAKIDILRIFEREIGVFPFPRSEQAVRALALLRGAAAGCTAAEAFMLLKEIV